MGELLKEGGSISLDAAGLQCDVLEYLGSGGQGEVYRVNVAGAPMALKWYYEHTGMEAQRQALAELVRLGAPTAQFLWPQRLVVSQGMPSFGYLMPLRPTHFKSMYDLVTRRVDPTFSVKVTAGFELASSFLELHTKGLSYRDISFGNVFFDPATGEVLVCDNDNVAIDGVAAGGVLGTPRFMAPEIVRGEATPSTQTDLFSLAVLLFYLLMIHHPLEGSLESKIRCMDAPAMKKLYGEDPVFIYDPQNDTNRPVAGVHVNPIVFWRVYPKFLRTLFTQAFTDGLRDPEKRIRESQWRKALIRLRDHVYQCQACGGENFLGGPSECIWCSEQLAVPRRLRIANTTEVVLAAGTKLYPHHLQANADYDFTRPLAEVAQHPTNPAILGLRNQGNRAWSATNAEGKLIQVDPGKSVTLSSGLRINFGGRDGTVEG